MAHISLMLVCSEFSSYASPPEHSFLLLFSYLFLISLLLNIVCSLSNAGGILGVSICMVYQPESASTEFRDGLSQILCEVVASSSAS